MKNKVDNKDEEDEEIGIDVDKDDESGSHDEKLNKIIESGS
jgi:hypothetical protein